MSSVACKISTLKTGASRSERVSHERLPCGGRLISTNHRCGFFSRYKRAPCEPSKRSEAVSNMIRAVFTDAHDILKLSGQKSSAIFAQRRNTSGCFAVAIVSIDCVERDVAVRLKVIASRIDEPPSAGDPIATHTGIREGLRLKTRATPLAPVGERRVTVDFVVHAYRSCVPGMALVLPGT